jgi:hypothetical protein
MDDYIAEVIKASGWSNETILLILKSNYFTSNIMMID